MNTKTNVNITKWDLFGQETFSDTYVIVKDRKNNDIQVALDTLLEDKPDDNGIYIKVYYYGQSWWISQDFYFPI